MFHGRDRELEYDLIVAPQADPSVIRMEFEGAQDLRIDANGDLVLTTAAGELRQRKPAIYQEVNGVRRSVQGKYVLLAGELVGFETARYDPAEPLVIDPVLTYSTYLGGDGNESVTGIALDEDQHIYVTGTTDSIDFPIVAPYQGSIAGANDAFVTKFAADGSHLIYSTYLGGVGGTSEGSAIAVEPAGAAFVVGTTSSSTFPLVDPFQFGYGGGASDAFLAALDPLGVPVTSTYVGGSGTDVGRGVARNLSGMGTFVVGDTDSPTVAGLNPTRVNQNEPLGVDVFVFRLPANIFSHEWYLVYLNGGQAEYASGIAVDRASSNETGVYVTGRTLSAPSTNPAQNPFPASVGAYQSPGPGTFVTKLVGRFGTLEYSALVGGDHSDPTGIALNPNCAGGCPTFVSGLSNETGFVFRLNDSGTQIEYDTPIGELDHHGAGPFAIAVGGDDSAYVTGAAEPAWLGICPSITGFGPFGGADGGGYVAKLDSQGEVTECAVIENAAAYAVAVDPAQTVYLAGAATDGLPTTPNAYDHTLGGVADAFVAKISNLAQPTIEFSAAAFSVEESGGSANVFVRRSGALSAPATVSYATSDDTATSPGDYGAASGTLMFAPGESTLYFSVPIVSDPIDEDNETLNLTLTNPGGGAVLGPQATATLTILDDDSTSANFTIRDRILAVGPNWTATLSPSLVGLVTLSATSGTGPSTVTASIDGGAEPLAGVYTGTITVTGDTGNSPQVIQVTATVE